LLAKKNKLPFSVFIFQKNGGLQFPFPFATYKWKLPFSICGNLKTCRWRHGEWRPGDIETFKHGDIEKWIHGDMVTL
jgi:hypothetical protein